MLSELIELIGDFIRTVDVKEWYSEELDEKLAEYLISHNVSINSVTQSSDHRVAVEYISREDAERMAIDGADKWAGECNYDRDLAIQEAIRRLPAANVIPISGCEGCKNVAFRYPYASMYPCVSCLRAHRTDRYERGGTE
jgi:hypothetical protein